MPSAIGNDSRSWRDRRCIARRGPERATQAARRAGWRNERSGRVGAAVSFCPVQPTGWVGRGNCAASVLEIEFDWTHTVLMAAFCGGAGKGAMSEHSAGSGTTRANRENDSLPGVSLALDYLRFICRLEAMPDNASGADKSWVHRAHADAVRHLSSAKRR